MVAEGRGRTTSCPIERNGRGVASPLPWRSPSGERTRRSRVPPHCNPCQLASRSTGQLACLILGCRVTATGASAIRGSAFQPSAVGFRIPAPVPLPSQSGQLFHESLMLHLSGPALTYHPKNITEANFSISGFPLSVSDATSSRPCLERTNLHRLTSLSPSAAGIAGCAAWRVLRRHRGLYRPYHRRARGRRPAWRPWWPCGRRA